MRALKKYFNELKAFFRNFKYTILLVLIVGVVVIGIVHVVKSSSDCEKKGGVYARTFDNRYKCVREIK